MTIFFKKYEELQEELMKIQKKFAYLTPEEDEIHSKLAELYYKLTEKERKQIRKEWFA